jgi:MFS family permease
LAVIAAIIGMGKVEQARVQMPAGSLRTWLGAQGGAVREGFQFIFSRPIILSSMILDFFASFFSSANTLLPFVAQDILHVGAVQYGWLSAGQSIGAVAAALVISQRLRIRRQGPLLLTAVTVFGVATVVFGLSRSFWLTLAALILVGAGDAVSTVLRNTLRQVNTPDSMRGRMVATTQLFFVGGPQLGEIESGLVAQAFGTPAAIISGGIGCLAAVAWVSARWPQIRKYDSGEPPVEPARA